MIMISRVQTTNKRRRERGGCNNNNHNHNITIRTAIENNIVQVLDKTAVSFMPTNHSTVCAALLGHIKPDDVIRRGPGFSQALLGED